MLEPVLYRRLISELSSRRSSTIRLPTAAVCRWRQPSQRINGIARRSLASLETPHTSTRAVTTSADEAGSPSRTSPSQSSLPPPPPLSEKVPSARQIAQYASSISRSSTFRSVTEPYKAYGSTELLYAECARQADYRVPNKLRKPPEEAPKNAAGEDIGEGVGVWFAPRSQGGLELPVTFTSWAQIMYLHLYILTVRFRRFSTDDVRVWNQHLMDHFYYAAEDKMEKWHGMAARGVRNKNLKDLWQQWRGTLLSYDEGLIKGDAMLAAAVWRAIFKADVNANVSDIASITAYLRQGLQKVDTMNDVDLIGGAFKFGNLGGMRGSLDLKSPSFSKPFNSEDVAQLEAVQADQQKNSKR